MDELKSMLKLPKCSANIWVEEIIVNLILLELSFIDC